MASLMENLIDVLDRESTEYEALLQLIGSVDIYEFLKAKQPLLSLHGHVHERPDTEKGSWMNQIGTTTCIQPGQTEFGDSSMVYGAAAPFK